ncbi:proteoglycan 4 [Vigna radiata var. radiata]|uniref:Proteoglycan 4 n=1 Tax=Vigna radiata var. radiata TaxID=3916 RepID=A0A1S3UFH5_VIGRR|nr:proteoglycan 4 [Vigna radiata var. radiata]
MAQRSKSFRFRIPWLSVPSESFARRVRDTPKSPPHSDTSVPIQRPSKPSSVAPSEPSPPSPTKTEPQKLSPPSPQPPLQPSPHADSPSKPHIAPSSPKTSLTSAFKASTPPASSSSEEEKKKMSELTSQEAEPKVEAPLRTISKSPETSFQPVRMSTQPADTEQQVSSVPYSSPVSKFELATHPSSPLASKDVNTEETTPQEEKEKMEEPVSEQEKPKINSPLKTITKSPQTSSQPENLSTQLPAIEQRSTTSNSKSLKSEKKEKMVPETSKERGKGKDTTTAATGQPSEQRTIASASGTTTTTKAKDSFGKAFRGNKKHHGVRETVERKLMFSTTNPIEKDTRVVNSTDEGTKNVSSSSISPEKAVSSSGEKAPPLQKGIKDDITKFVHKLTSTVHPTEHMDDKQFSVITLVGDNRGATMHLGSESAKKEDSIHIHRAYKSDPEETNEVTSDGEENTNEEEEEEEDLGMAYVNSNIQSINNSLMFHGSITERDPGVQITLPQKPTEPIRSHDKPKPGLETQRTQFNINRAEKSMYQPTVGRSIRGPFLEPNAKRRRQSCKFSCDKDIEDIEIM